MDADPTAQFFVDDVEGGAGSDAELRCAFDGLYEVSPNARLDVNLESSNVGQNNPFAFGVAYGDGHMLAQVNTMNVGFSYEDTCSIEKADAKKRGRDDTFPGPKSKACREKIRRDKLNDRFLELSSVLDPGRPPKSDKASILSDAARMLMQLKTEADELKATNEKLQESMKELKAEKNELRDEKMRLKVEKERLEQQVKSMAAIPPAGFMPHPVVFHPGIAGANGFAPAAAAQAAAGKSAPAMFPGYPAIPMWQWLPPAACDTTQDAKLYPPNA